MIKAICLILAISALPYISLAAEDTHGVLVDRGTARTNTGRADLPPPADAQKPAPSTDATALTDDNDAQKKADSTDNSNANSKATHKTTQAEFTHNYESKSRDYYNRLHSGSDYTNTHIQN